MLPRLAACSLGAFVACLPVLTLAYPPVSTVSARPLSRTMIVLPPQLSQSMPFDGWQASPFSCLFIIGGHLCVFAIHRGCATHANRPIS